MDPKELFSQLLKLRLEKNQAKEFIKPISQITGHQTLDFNRRFAELWCEDVIEKLQSSSPSSAPPSSSSAPSKSLNNFPRDELQKIVQLCLKRLKFKCFVLLLETIVRVLLADPMACEWEGLLKDVANHIVGFYGDCKDGDECESDEVLVKICVKLFKRFEELIDVEATKVANDQNTKRFNEKTSKRCQFVVKLCESNNEICVKVWKKFRNIFEEDDSRFRWSLGWILGRTRLIQDNVSLMYGKHLFSLVKNLMENPFGLSLKSCGHFIQMIVQRSPVDDLSINNCDGYFWLSREFPAWTVAVQILCFVAEREVMASLLRLCGMLLPGWRTCLNDIESLVSNLRCLSAKTRLTSNEVKFSLASLKVNRKRSFKEVTPDEEGAPVKKRAKGRGLDEPITRKDFQDVVFASQPMGVKSQSLAPPSGLDPKLIEDLLCYFVVTQKNINVKLVFDLILELPNFNKRQKLADDISSILDVVERFKSHPSSDWTDRVVTNARILIGQEEK